MAIAAGLAPAAMSAAPWLSSSLIEVPARYLSRSNSSRTALAMSAALATWDWLTWVPPLSANTWTDLLLPTRPIRFLLPISSARTLADSSAFSSTDESCSHVSIPGRPPWSASATFGAEDAICTSSAKPRSLMSFLAPNPATRIMSAGSRPLPPRARARPMGSAPSTACWNRSPGNLLNARP